MIPISVIICTYNPMESVFDKCLAALSQAVLFHSVVEIIIIDNNSHYPVASLHAVKQLMLDHSYCRVIREEKQGLTNARLRGISESSGDLLIFIDDDNIVASDFMMHAAKIASEHICIGAFSGQVEVVSDIHIPSWSQKYLGMLVHRIFKGNHWSNLYFNEESMPCGAGLCVRRIVASHYVALHEQGKRSFMLDRSKNSLLSGGDNDLAMCAIDVGMGMGLFEKLYMKHHIDASRFTLRYLSKLAYGIYYSTAVLKYLRTGQLMPISFKRKMLNFIRYMLMNKEDRRINKATQRGLEDAYSYLSTLK